MATENPHKISKMDTSLTLTGAIRDDLDFPHSGLFRAMGQYTKGCFAIRGSLTDFDITLDSPSTYSRVAVAAGKVFVHNKYVAVSALAATNLDASYADGGGGTNADLTPLSGTYVYLMIVYDADAGAIKIRGSSNSAHNNSGVGKIPLFMNNNGDDKPNDVPIAILRLPNDGDDDGHTKIAVQYLTTSMSENSLEIGYTSGSDPSKIYNQAMTISSNSSGDIIFEQKVSNKDFTFKMNDGGTTRDVFNLEAETGMSFNQKQDMTNNLAVGWHSIALVEGETPGGLGSGTYGTGGQDQRAFSKFYIKEQTSSRHQLIVFDAVHLYGGNNHIHVYQTGDFSTEVVTQLRIKDKSTYDGAVLQMYVADATNNIQVYIQDNYMDKGWQLIDAVVDASDPSTGSLGVGHDTAYSGFDINETVNLSNGILQGGARFNNVQLDNIYPDDGTNVTIESQTANSTTSGPNLILYRNGATAEDSDLIGQIIFKGKNDAGSPQSVNYVTIEGGMDDVTDGSEDGHLTFNLREGGDLVEFMRIRAGTRDVVVNDQSDDIDFRVESDNNQNMLFVDASVDAVGIGTATPDTNAALDVEGSIALDEISAPTATANRGKIWTQTDNNMYFQDGAGTNTVLLKGGKHTIWIPASAMTVGVSGPSASVTSIDSGTVNTTIPVLDFDGGSSDEVATFQIAFPKSWNASTVTARFFWTNSNANAGNVVWGLQGVCVVNDAALNLAMSDAGETIQDANITTAGDMMVTSETSAITINGAADDGVCFFNVFRDASDTSNDTYASDARLVGVQVFYTIDSGNDE
jgi:hypothetical protein